MELKFQQLKNDILFKVQNNCKSTSAGLLSSEENQILSVKISLKILKNIEELIESADYNQDLVALFQSAEAEEKILFLLTKSLIISSESISDFLFKNGVFYSLAKLNTFFFEKIELNNSAEGESICANYLRLVRVFLHLISI